MTKQEIINALREREEYKWDRYVATKQLFGEDNASTIYKLQEWNETYKILGELGITTFGEERVKGFAKARRQAEKAEKA